MELKIAQTPEIREEGYLLNIFPTFIVITANTKAGIVYGLQTIFQFFKEFS